VYRFSRSIYRELAPRVIEDCRNADEAYNKQQVLEACEGAIRRLACDRRYFARPARSLFNEIRPYFSVNDQRLVWVVVETNIHLALEFLARLPEEVGLDGRPPQCNAHTRKGTPCQRTPLPSRDYCPSHKHLEETFESVELPIAAPAPVGVELIAA
jgi:hypothetical protein